MHSMKDDWVNMGPGNCASKDSITKQIVLNIATEHEKLVIESFKKCGYSMEWIVGNLHRVQCKEFPMTNEYLTKTVYGVDHHPLFAIVNRMVIDMENLRVDIKTTVEFKENEHAEVLY